MTIQALKTYSILNAKNVVGWRTDRKIVVFSVDDYGNVRVDSKAARQRMNQHGLKVYNRFDAYDTLETREDIEVLFETLMSVTDSNGRNAVFTPFAVPCNINFEKMAANGYQKYEYELLPQTFSKLSSQQPEAYDGAWELIQEGITEKIFLPQFHGREHLNLKIFEEKLASNDNEILTALKNRSYTSISAKNYETITPSAAFEFWDVKENDRFKDVICDGLRAFKDVFGYPAVHFNPPGGREHPVIHKALYDNGIKYLDTPLLKNEHQGKGDYRTVFNYTGKQNTWGQIYLVRNVVFEPTDDRGLDWVGYAMKQIETAFRWNRPAIISSHRVNFCGHIDEQNRAIGITALQELLDRIIARWPEVEFLSANELGETIEVT
ncbi:hypothetical protein [Fodinibius sp. Rm-B-1B1-1]|uniref:hypothetical protein n=1 Tax=Fodinibius alkaliphilus TaxID=3140241 RepID=UPI00315ABFB6